MLQDLAAKAERANDVSSSKRSRQSAFEIYPMLCESLSRIPPASKLEQMGGKLEVEVRVGMLVDGPRRMHPQLHQQKSCLVYEFDESKRGAAGYEFKSGIDEDMVERLKRSFQNEKFKETKQPLQTLHVDDAGNRWEVRDKNEIVHLPERKSRLTRLDFALLAHNYDVRIDTAVESALDQRTSSIDPNKWTLVSCPNDHIMFTK